MKKFISLCIFAAICLLFFAGCAATKDNTDHTQTESAAASQTATPGTSAVASAAPAGSASADSGIIAKSSNTVSDKEKQKILNDLSSQLDDALNNIANLEDLDESDLNIDNIQ